MWNEVGVGQVREEARGGHAEYVEVKEKSKEKIGGKEQDEEEYYGR